MDNTKTINILSLCTGYGGLELGLAGALEGIFRVVAVEVEAYALANLAAKAQEGKLAIEAMWPDLKTFPAERFRGCFDFILAGYPCQPFSVAGKRQGTDDPRHLWPHIARIVQAVRPVWCFFENVPGHLTIGYPEVYRSLRNMGYSVEAGIFSAAECGAPHRRERLFILANCENYRLQGFAAEGLEQGGTTGTYENVAQSETTKWGRLQEKYTGRGIEKAGRPNRSQLGNARSPEPRGLSNSQRQEDSTIGSASQLANSNITGCEERCGAEPIREKYLSPQCSYWPARPGQLQYEWEEPRVVADARCGSSSGRKKCEGLQQARASELRETDSTSRQQGQAQSRLGRAVDGTKSRVDRLRLLGNGVVPQQAEKAFRYLIGLWSK